MPSVLFRARQVMFYNQPLATRFGTNLLAHIRSGNWTKLEIAVAWVRDSGMRHLSKDLTSFLLSGNELSVVVGIDLDNTTYEGLHGLLALETSGKAETFVHHNEAGTIFHPKLFLFRNNTDAKLIVGSNNITEAGLFQNTEAGLEIEAPTSDPTIVSAATALESWRDPSLRIARRLDKSLLDDLVNYGYVKDEAAARAAARTRRARTTKSAKGLMKLFGTLRVTPPLPASGAVSAATAVGQTQATKSTGKTSKKPGSAPGSSVATGHGQVLLMRVRKARGTQVQIPLAVKRTPFFAGASTVVSAATGLARGIHETHAARSGPGANPNTLKLEMPETATMSDPFARFERTASGIQYEVYDKNSPKGRAIHLALVAGRTTRPPTTYLTIPSSPSTCTWWRFI